MQNRNQPPKHDDDQLDILSSLQILAIKSREKPTVDSFIRSAQRWFSFNLHTPIKDVEKLPVEEILLHYYEDYVSKLESDKYKVFKNAILKNKDLSDKDEEDEAWIQEQLRLIEEERAKVKQKAEKEAEKEVSELFKVSVEDLNNNIIKKENSGKSE